MKFTKSLATKKCDKKNVVRKSTKYVTEINAKTQQKKAKHKRNKRSNKYKATKKKQKKASTKRGD